MRGSSTRGHADGWPSASGGRPRLHGGARARPLPGGCDPRPPGAGRATGEPPHPPGGRPGRACEPAHRKCPRPLRGRPPHHGRSAPRSRPNGQRVGGPQWPGASPRSHHHHDAGRAAARLARSRRQPSARRPGRHPGARSVLRRGEGPPRAPRAEPSTEPGASVRARHPGRPGDVPPGRPSGGCGRPVRGERGDVRRPGDRGGRGAERHHRLRHREPGRADPHVAPAAHLAGGPRPARREREPRAGILARPRRHHGAPGGA